MCVLYYHFVVVVFLFFIDGKGIGVGLLLRLLAVHRVCF
jgi:hypothetical protein